MSYLMYLFISEQKLDMEAEIFTKIARNYSGG